MFAARFAFGAVFLAGDAFAHLSVAKRVADLEPEDNPPRWPDSVHIFGPEDQERMNITDVIEKLTEDLTNVTTGHFSDRRVALMFKPGEYKNVTVKVGYYTQLLGLGLTADDVVFTNTSKGVYAPADVVKPDPGSLDNFWRSAENFKTEASEGFVWSVSQAAPIRRVHVAGNLTTDEDGAWASGGFMANVLVDGHTSMGGQQQWMSRNSDLGSPHRKVMGGMWNMVFVGCTGAPAPRYPLGTAGDVAITNEPTTPVIAEKPFITIDNDGNFSLQIPPVRWDTVGSDLLLTPNESATITVPFQQVYVADPEDSMSVAFIQAKLDAGRHVLMPPGIYYLSNTLELKFPGQVLLGIGMATLNPPATGGPCIRVAPGIPNVRVAGLMLGAKKQSHENRTVTSLLEWGTEDGNDAGNRQQPGVLSDIFARVGGPNFDRTVSVDKMIRIFSGNVIGDNLWLWRADHALLNPAEPPQNITDPKKEFYHLVEKEEYPCEAGLEVLGDHVTMYGLFVEHTLGNMTQWRGDAGSVFFYQSELPYDVNETYGTRSIAGYVVDERVKTHQAHGIGVYTYFRDHNVNVESGILAPDTDGVRFTNAFTRFLNGHGGINHVLSGKGDYARGDGSRMGRLGSSLGDELPEECPESAEKKSNTVLIVIVVILIILIAITAFYAFMLRDAVMKKATAPSQDPDNVRNQDISLAQQPRS